MLEEGLGGRDKGSPLKHGEVEVGGEEHGFARTAPFASCSLRSCFPNHPPTWMSGASNSSTHLNGHKCRPTLNEHKSDFRPPTWMSGQQLMAAWLSPATPCTAPGPETVSSTAGTPVRKPAAAAA